jgi:hypothetical protein
MTTQVDVKSISNSVQKGTLVELAGDYRTSRTVRAYLPVQPLCAMSATAFQQYVMQGKAGKFQSRLEAMCLVLGNLLKLKAPAPELTFEFRVLDKDGQTQVCPLKLEWFAPDKYWVVLLPHEFLQSLPRPG